ncbi:HD-GYP domain-containing protein [Methylobacterium sp. sgz302541]|uniref:HD-GYP domain-containing protein n=1 Tax=unclassified Methylobacterium TaxID=2615210 RepID=UPI003D329198
MDRILLITDDVGRSRGRAQELAGELPCEIHDLYGGETPAGPASALVADIHDLGSGSFERLRRFLAHTRRGAPLVVLLHQNSQRARMAAIALGATQTVCAPFDMTLVREMVGAAHATPTALPHEGEAPLPACAVQTAAEARAFFTTAFVPDRPINPSVVDTGTDFIGRAIHDTGIRDWVRAVHRFDDATHQHCLLVAGLAAAFAASLGLGDLECHRLTKAALLHDVGKIHVPAAILNKPGKLDEAEMALVRLHPEEGHRMLVDQGFEPEMLAVVRSHHEMLDGSGYPDRLAGDAIPDLVRLVTVCDIYAALIERRSYKAPMPSEKAFAILDGMAGRLDPAVVGAFRPVAAAFIPRFPCDA